MQHHGHPPLAQRPPLLLPLLAQRLPRPPLPLCCAARPCSTAAACLPRQRPCAVGCAREKEPQQLRTCANLVRAATLVPLNMACMRSGPASAPQLHHNTRPQKHPPHRAGAAPHQHMGQVCKRVAAHHPDWLEAEAGVVGD